VQFTNFRFRNVATLCGGGGYFRGVSLEGGLIAGGNISRRASSEISAYSDTQIVFVTYLLTDLRVLMRILASTTSMVDSTNVLCPRFDEIEFLIPGDSRGILPSLDKKFYFVIESKKK